MRASEHAPHSLRLHYIYHAAEDLILWALQCKCAVVKIRVRRIRRGIMAVYYLANYRYFLIRPGRVARADRQIPAIRQ